MFFCGEAAKKASIDGLKWRDLVIGRWWLVNFVVSAVRCHKGLHVLNSARRSVTMIATHVQPIPSQSYFKRNSGESFILFILRAAPQLLCIASFMVPGPN